MTGIQKMNKPLILLFALFCLNIGYCTSHKITSNNFNYKQLFTKPPKSHVNNNFGNACSLSEASTKVSVSDVERSSGTDLRITTLTTIFTAIRGSSSIVHFKFFQPGINHTISPIPLFLKNRSLII